MTDRPGTITEFRLRMRRLRSDCGNPTQAQMRHAIAAFKVDKLARATLSEFLNDIRGHSLPKWEFVRSFVAACLLYHGDSPHCVTKQLSLWATWWTQLGVDGNKGEPAVDPIVRTEPPVRPRRQWPRTLLALTAAAVAGFIAGLSVGGGWWRLSPGQDPSLSYGICAEALTPSTQVGQIALLADTGPPGKPILDRRVELRVQKHPDHGWIAWAYLERTPSDLDRLWLDWSYLETPGSDQSNWRQCGAQPVTDGRGTPALRVTDADGRPRWFRACGQAPPQDRAPDRAGTFCTSWTRPRT